MRIIKGIKIPITICVSYTIISFGTTVLELFLGYTSTSHLNTLAKLLWTSIAVLILSFHYLFDNWPPLLMILVQYLIAMGLVFLMVFITGFFNPVSENGFWDVFRSFTIPYIIGAIIYYISVFYYARKQNSLLQQIQEKANTKE